MAEVWTAGQRARQETVKGTSLITHHSLGAKAVLLRLWFVAVVFGVVLLVAVAAVSAVVASVVAVVSEVTVVSVAIIVLVTGVFVFLHFGVVVQWFL